MFFIADSTLTGHDGQTLVDVGEILTVEALQALTDRHGRTPHEDATLPGVWCLDAATAQQVQAETIHKWKTRFAQDFGATI